MDAMWSSNLLRVLLFASAPGADSFAFSAASGKSCHWPSDVGVALEPYATNRDRKAGKLLRNRIWLLDQYTGVPRNAAALRLYRRCG